jgi:hypothetical protein
MGRRQVELRFRVGAALRLRAVAIQRTGMWVPGLGDLIAGYTGIGGRGERVWKKAVKTYK